MYKYTSDIYELKKIVKPKIINLSDYILEEREGLEDSFYEFIRAAWPHIDGRPFKNGWHIEAIAEHLEALYMLEIRNLIINCPPRVGKSSIVCVLYPAWIWAKTPNLRFLFTSYAQSLSTRDSVACRRLIMSDWYQARWGDKFKLMSDVNNKMRFDNNRNGYRICSSVDGSNTGDGGDFQVCDDPNNIRDIQSKVVRDSVNEWYSTVMPTRFSDFKTGRRLITQQRTHVEDLTGHVLSKNRDGWVHLSLPMEYDPDRKCKTICLGSNPMPWQDPREVNNELLWPEGIGELELYDLKCEFNWESHRIAGQLQMEPFDRSGGLIKTEWFRKWYEVLLPEIFYVIQSWDTALTDTETSCYSACTTWGLFKDRKGVTNIMLLSVFQARLNYPDLRKMAIRLANNYEDTTMDEPYPQGYKNPPHLILIEAKVSGYGLFSDLFEAGLPVSKFNPNLYGDKYVRCQMVSHLIENGLVWLQTAKPEHLFLTKEAQLLLQNAAAFSETDPNDIVDSMSQAFIRMKQQALITNRFDPEQNNESLMPAHQGSYTTLSRKTLML